MDVSEDEHIEDQITGAQKRSTLSSRSENITSPRQNPNSQLLEAHSKSSGPGDHHFGPTVKEQPRSINPEFKIHWVPSVAMVAFFISGVSFAAGHHAYYSSLDGTKVRDDESQQWAIRFGTAFAFLVEVSLATAVSIAQTQRAWTTVERKSVSIGGIDAVFAATRDLGSFMSWEMLSRAKLASLLALICWCMPLSALVTPATLSVQAVSQTRNVEKVVSAIDFNNRANFAGFAAGYLDPAPNKGIIGGDLFTSPSPFISLLSVVTASTGAIQPMPALFFNASYSNATYSLDFYGPAIECKAANLSAEYSPLNEGDYYSGMVPGRDQVTGKVIPVDLSRPLEPTAYNFSHPIAPELWFRVIDIWPSQRPCADCWRWRNFTCALYNTSYSVDFAFNGGVQSTNIKSINYIEPMRWCRGVPGNDSIHSSLYGVMAYQAIWVALSQQLVGTLGSRPNSRIMQIPLIASKWNISTSTAYMAGNRTLDVLIEELAQNITLSLFSNSDLWNQNNTTPTTVTIGEKVNIYTYRCQNILISYITAVVFALIGTAVGLISLIINERSYRTPSSFSAILCTTRNHDLDELVGARSLGAEPLDQSLANTRLRFGTVDSIRSDSSASTGHTAFGLSNAVSPITRASALSSAAQTTAHLRTSLGRWPHRRKRY
ncbi:hypothetical protein MMC22_008451 [Lobaria immixta]|nr:hypothetical protein [Lobaria immixta]